MTPTATAAPIRKSGLIGQLNAQWAQLADHATPPAWADAGLTALTLGAIPLDLRSSSSASADATLHALLVLTRAGDELAERVLLQAMLPKIVRLERTALGRHLADPSSDALFAMWTSITTYPLHRTTSVAANLALDALHHIPAQDIADGIHVIPLFEDSDEGLSTDDNIDRQLIASLEGREETSQPNGRDLIVEVLQWALDHEILTRDDVALLALVHLRDDDDPLTLKQAGEQLGLSHAATRQRHARAVRALASAVASSTSRDANAA